LCKYFELSRDYRTHESNEKQKCVAVKAILNTQFAKIMHRLHRNDERGFNSWIWKLVDRSLLTKNKSLCVKTEGNLGLHKVGEFLDYPIQIITAFQSELCTVRLFYVKSMR
jgi:hypothetical protein